MDDSGGTSLMTIVKSCEFTRGCEYLGLRPIPQPRVRLASADIPGDIAPGVDAEPGPFGGRGQG